MRFRPVDRPRGLPAHCAPLAASVVLGVPYSAAHAALGYPRPGDVVLIADMGCYLLAHGIGRRWFDPVPLRDAAGELRSGRHLCFTKLERDGREVGHYVAVVDGCLRDLEDTRDGAVVLAWSRRWPAAEVRPYGPPPIFRAMATELPPELDTILARAGGRLSGALLAALLMGRAPLRSLPLTR